jgi:hypothetical protein
MTERRPALSYAPLVVVVALALSSLAGCGRAQAFESFTLEEHDKLIAEAPGCYADCRGTAGGRRVCSLKNLDCQAICQSVPECKPDGTRMLRVCVVMKAQR